MDRHPACEAWLACTCATALQPKRNERAGRGSADTLAAKARRRSHLCAKKQILRLQLLPSLQSWVRYLPGGQGPAGACWGAGGGVLTGCWLLASDRCMFTCGTRHRFKPCITTRHSASPAPTVLDAASTRRRCVHMGSGRQRRSNPPAGVEDQRDGYRAGQCFVPARRKPADAAAPKSLSSAECCEQRPAERYQVSEPAAVPNRMHRAWTH